MIITGMSKKDEIIVLEQRDDWIWPKVSLYWDSLMLCCKNLEEASEQLQWYLNADLDYFKELTESFNNVLNQLSINLMKLHRWKIDLEWDYFIDIDIIWDDCEVTLCEWTRKNNIPVCRWFWKNKELALEDLQENIVIEIKTTENSVTLIEKLLKRFPLKEDDNLIVRKRIHWKLDNLDIDNFIY